MGENPDREAIQKERDFYERLLRLGPRRELAPLLREALSLIVEITGAGEGYIELYQEPEATDTAGWSIAHGLSEAEIADVQAQISRGIIAEAVATGQTIATHSALDDPRFMGRESVQVSGIKAVLCAPIGDVPVGGVLYLQRRWKAGMFSTADRLNVELFAGHLEPLIDRLLAEHRAQQTQDPTLDPRKMLRRLDGVVGRSRALAETLRQAALVAPLDIDVLLTGDSGTGKSQLARILHDNSKRAGGPFLELNCAALQDTLIESELFGALPGSFTGATHRVVGKVEAAERGTLFLDEIGEMSLQAQAKLLQLLQSREYFPVGSSKKMVADVRIVAATNADLDEAVAAKRFRQDLFYRMQVMPLRVPALTERRDDIPDLLRSFVDGACRKHRLPQLEISRNAVRAATVAPWPGNIRQLQHAAEAAAVRAAGSAATQVEANHLFPGHQPSPSASGPSTTGLTFQDATRSFHEQLLRETLEATDWNVTEACRRLDLARSHMYSLIRAFGIERRKPEAP